MTARFFFWKPGGELQNTLNGVKRTLLHDILHECPDLIPSVLPQAWKVCRAIPWQAGDGKFEISRSEVEEAFSNLFTHATTSTCNQRCFCIFIDGLDEYVGTPGCDTKDMVDELQGWVRQASHVKICVSSRPDNVFMNAFGPHRQIRLHDLTRGDMQAYIRAQLSHMDSPKAREELVRLITEKAQGIFLWVTLAVKSLREQMENGFSSADMIRNVRLLPSEMEQLFKHILDSLIDPQKGYRALVMIKLAMDHHIKLPLYSYSFFDDYDQDCRFAFSLQTRELRTHTAPSDQEYIQLARKKLRGHCGGLIEDVRHSEWDRYLRERVSDQVLASKGLKEYPLEFNVDFTHRSIPEFLESAEMQQNIHNYTKDFSGADCLSQLFLATLTQRADGAHLSVISSNHFVHPSLMYQIPWILGLREDTGLDVAPFEFWEHFELVQEQRYPDHRIDWETPAELFMEEYVYGPASALSYRPAKPENETIKVSKRSLVPPVYIAAHIGFIDYPLWKVRTAHDGNSVKANESPNQVILITHLALHHHGLWSPDCWLGDTCKLVQELLRQGYVTIHTSTDFWIKDDFEVCNVPATINIWHQYILRLMTGKAASTLMSHMTPAAADTIEMFLRQGGSPHLSMSWKWKSRKVKKESEVSDIEGCDCSGTKRCVEINALSDGMMFSIDISTVFVGEGSTLPGMDYTFRHWVTEWPDDVPQKQNVLHLIDRNSRPDFCPPSIERQASFVEPAQSDEKRVHNGSSDDTIRGSESSRNSKVDPKVLEVPLAPDVKSTSMSEENLNLNPTLRGNVPLLTKQNSEGPKVDMTFTVAMFFLGMRSQLLPCAWLSMKSGLIFLVMLTLTHYPGVITTVIV